MTAPLIPYRPLRPGDAMAASLRILRARLGLFVAITLMPLVVVFLGTVVVVVLTLSGFMESLLSLIPGSTHYTGGPLDLVRIFAPAGWAVLGTLVLTALVSLAAYSMTAQTTRAADEGRPLRFLPLLGRTFSTVGHLLLILVGILLATAAFVGLIVLPWQLLEDNPAWFIVGVGMFLAGLLAVPFGIFLAVRLGFLVQGLAVEGRTALGTVKRSWQVTRGHFWRILAHVTLLVVATVIILGVPGIISSALAGWQMERAVGTGTNPSDPSVLGLVLEALWILRTIAALALVPFQQIYLTVLFIDLTRRAGAHPPIPAPRRPGTAAL